MWHSDDIVKNLLQTPLVDALRTLSHQPDAAFYTPGHKRGEGMASFLADWWGKALFCADLPELPELDNLFAPAGVIREAQLLAAKTFGSQKTWFLVNGSTCGVMAAILATCGSGDKIILPRNIHQSAIAGLVISGATPIFLNPEYDPELDLAYSVTPEAIAEALKAHPDTKAVMVVYPTYHGICGNLEAIVKLVHQYKIPLLVDEAHGAHFSFHPDLPPSALSLGADVAIQSTHKVLGAMTQASMLHLQGNLVAPERLSQALQMLQSSSPSYLLLASLDAARQQMAVQGKALMAKTLYLADYAKKRLNQISGVRLIEAPKQKTSGFWQLDQTRVTVNLQELGIDGFSADEILHQQLGVTAELPMLQSLTFIITFGNTQEDINKLINGFTELTKLELSASSTPNFSLSPSSLPPVFLSPRQAWFCATKTLPIKEAVGCVSAELICPYPPGIPILMPGEEVTISAIEYLQRVIASGGMVTGLSDSTLQTLKVVRIQ